MALNPTRINITTCGLDINGDPRRVFKKQVKCDLIKLWTVLTRVTFSYLYWINIIIAIVIKRVEATSKGIIIDIPRFNVYPIRQSMVYQKSTHYTYAAFYQ